MRFEDWDILLFSTGRDSKVPVKEFRVACKVVPDMEFSHSHGTYGLPIMTCFIPALAPGTPFNISIHRWRPPQVSHYTRTYSKHTELVKFEARILIDGLITASASFDQKAQWPNLITNTCEFTKAGEFEPLKFPAFRQEMLYMNHWHPSDEIGRIKIVISEGFPRDSLSAPFDRVKNIVAFSFQHAPLEILETNGIAWPNPLMWRGQLTNACPHVPTFHPDDGSDSHGHSPRRRSGKPAGGASASRGVYTPSGPPGVDVSLASGTRGQKAAFPRRTGATSASSVPDVFADPALYKEWLVSSGLRSEFNPAQTPLTGKPSGTDTSMPDYVPSTNAMPDVMHISGPSLEDDFVDAQVDKVSANTPEDAALTAAADFSLAMPFGFGMENSAIPRDLATSLTQSLLNHPQPQPLPRLLANQMALPATDIRSRKENRPTAGLPGPGTRVGRAPPHASSSHTASPAAAGDPDGMPPRNFSQPPPSYHSQRRTSSGLSADATTRVSSPSLASAPSFSRTTSGRFVVALAHTRLSALGLAGAPPSEDEAAHHRLSPGDFTPESPGYTDDEEAEDENEADNEAEDEAENEDENEAENEDEDQDEDEYEDPTH